jgi:hypothetical protein
MEPEGSLPYSDEHKLVKCFRLPILHDLFIDTCIARVSRLYFGRRTVGSNFGKSHVLIK